MQCVLFDSMWEGQEQNFVSLTMKLVVALLGHSGFVQFATQSGGIADELQSQVGISSHLLSFVLVNLSEHFVQFLLSVHVKQPLEHGSHDSLIQ